MKLIRLDIENFGKLSHYSLDLKDGLNTVCEENGWGKTTLAVFIKAMFYGLPVNGKRNLDENERKKFTPWNGGAFGGSIVFQTAKGRFRAERFFGAKESSDEFRLFDLATNTESFVYSSSLGEELFGIDADGFERSTYLSQRALDSLDNPSIHERLTGLLEDTNDESDFDKAMELLDNRRKVYLLSGNRGRIADLQAEIHRLEEDLRVRRENLRVQKDQEQARMEKKEEIREKRERLRAIGASYEAAMQAQTGNVIRARTQQMESQLAQKLARLDQIRSDFGGTVPSGEELNAHQALLDSIHELSAQRNAIKASTEGWEQYSRLKERYPDGFEEDLRAVSECDERLRRLEIEAGTLSGRIRTDAQDHFRSHPMPDAEELLNCSAALDRAETAKQELHKKGNGWTPLAVGFSLLGLLLLAFAFLSRGAVYAFPISICGGGTLFLGLVFCAVALSKRNRKRAVNPEEWLSPVRELLKRYGMPYGDSALRASLNDLIHYAEDARHEMQSQAQDRQKLAEVQAEREEQFARVTLIFRRHGILIESVHDAALQMQLDCDRLASLKLENENLQVRISNLTEQMQEKVATLNSFFARLTHRKATTPDDCMREIFTLCAEFDRLSGEAEEDRSALEIFRSQNPIAKTDPASLGSPEDWKRQSELLNEEIRRDEEEASRIEASVNRLSDSTAVIPELSDRLDERKAELEIAVKNLDRIQKVASLLQESKQALSTRYLGGMQDSVRKYLSIFTGTDASNADLDINFSLNLREGGKSRVPESFSRGWRDLLRFCVRLALVDALFEGNESPFLLLDDPFVNLDPERFASAKTLVGKLSEKFQIVYLICHPERS